jgi:hypothetical protein
MRKEKKISKCQIQRLFLNLYRVILNFSNIIVGVENPTNFGCAASLATDLYSR